MPYEWCEPDLFLEYKNVAIYHCYDDSGTPAMYWYTTDPVDCDIDAPLLEDYQFDVRDLPSHGLSADDPKSHPEIIRKAIEAGLLTGGPANESGSLYVKIEVIGGVAHVMEQPPGVYVEIIDRDIEEVAGDDS